jgi:hypothetical protein
VQPSAPESKNPKPLYLWEDPPLSNIPSEPAKDEEGYVTLRTSKKEYDEWTGLVDIRATKKLIAERKPVDSYVRRLINTEPDFIRNYE